MPHLPIKNALISVSNTEGIIPFVKMLEESGIDIIATGDSIPLLRQENIALTDASEIKEHDKDHIDLVVANLSFKENISYEETLKNIDMESPAMIRAAARNMHDVTVVVDPEDYHHVLALIQNQKGLTSAHRKALAQKAFIHTAQYDAHISQYLANSEEDFHDFMLLPLRKAFPLRIGENPHQKATAYHLGNENTGILNAHMHQGKPLSYNNLLDADTALGCVQEFESPACVIVKQRNPCGVALGENIHEAFIHAQKADSTSAFGGIIALNRDCDLETAKAIPETFFEVLLAPGFTEEALEQLATKSALRVLELPYEHSGNPLNYQFIRGGLLIQTTGHEIPDVRQFEVVTQKTPDFQEMDTLLFAWKVVKHIQSNAIVLARNKQSLAIEAGKVSHVDVVEAALSKAGENASMAVLASDGFFPFRDSIDLLAKAGITALIQPGGSMRDPEIIEACNEHGMAMVFTGNRCFKY